MTYADVVLYDVLGRMTDADDAMFSNMVMSSQGLVSMWKTVSNMVVLGCEIPLV